MNGGFPGFMFNMPIADTDPEYEDPTTYPRCVEITDSDALMSVASAEHLLQEVNRLQAQIKTLQSQAQLYSHKREAAKIELFTQLASLYPQVETGKRHAGCKFVVQGERAYYVAWDLPAAA